jgi:RNA polymerase sigma factor (sigma-70 family)
MSREKELGLVRKLQTGDRDAFAELWTAGEPTVRRFLASTMWFGRDYLDDCIQECAVRALSALLSKTDSYDGTASFTTWLCTIAVRVRADLFRRLHGRKQKRQIVSLDQPEADRESRVQVPPNEQLDVQARLLVEKLEAKLSKLENKVLSALRAGFNCTEITQQLGIKEQTVYQATRRIRDKAKRLFREKKNSKQTAAPLTAKKAMAQKM